MRKIHFGNVYDIRENEVTSSCNMQISNFALLKLNPDGKLSITIENSMITTNPNKVTCKSCLKKIRKNGPGIILNYDMINE